MPKLDIKPKTLRRSDGTLLRYFDTEAEDQPCLVLANGLGGPLTAWTHQIERFRDRFRILSWDYRGLYGSAFPKGQVPDLSIQAHVDDLRAILDASGVRRAVLCGWSMGVQVVLELAHRDPDLATHLVLINGTFGRPLHGVGLPLAGHILPQAVTQARRLHHVGSVILQRASRWPDTGRWLKRFGVIADSLDPELFADMAVDFGSLDLEVYLTMLAVLGEHDAAHVLPTIKVPTLVITGTRDLFTPPLLAERMAETIPRGELLIVPGGTHYAAAEFPEVINRRIDRFLGRHGAWQEELTRAAG
jgi:pimeloyl-ACP methyl ester carboxylesterase